MILPQCKNIQSTPLSCSAAVWNVCSFNSATGSCFEVSMCCRSHAFTWGQSSPSLNFGSQRNAKLFAQACASGLTHSHEWMEVNGIKSAVWLRLKTRENERGWIYRWVQMTVRRFIDSLITLIFCRAALQLKFDLFNNLCILQTLYISMKPHEPVPQS